MAEPNFMTILTTDFDIFRFGVLDKSNAIAVPGTMLLVWLIVMCLSKDSIPVTLNNTQITLSTVFIRTIFYPESSSIHHHCICMAAEKYQNMDRYCKTKQNRTKNFCLARYH